MPIFEHRSRINKKRALGWVPRGRMRIDPPEMSFKLSSHSDTSG
jgi:hypothetical protein